MSERWREIINYPGYEVSDKGRVRSWRTRGIGGGKRLRPLILKTSEWRQRLRVGLSHNGRVQNKMVHRLVLCAFRGEPPAGMECCHYNGDSRDNRLSNLRWDTRLGNNADDIRNGTRARRPKHVRPKLTEEQVREIRARHDAQIVADNKYITELMQHGGG